MSSLEDSPASESSDDPYVTTGDAKKDEEGKVKEKARKRARALSRNRSKIDARVNAEAQAQLAADIAKLKQRSPTAETTVPQDEPAVAATKRTPDSAAAAEAVEDAIMCVELTVELGNAQVN